MVRDLIFGLLFDFVSFIFMVLMENEYLVVGVKIMLIYACLMY